MVEKNRAKQFIKWQKNLQNLETDDELFPKLSQIIFEKSQKNSKTITKPDKTIKLISNGLPNYFITQKTVLRPR